MKILLALLFLNLSFLPTAFADTETDETARSGPCRADVEKLCKGIQPGEGRIVNCLKQNEAQVSAACKARREKHKERRAERRENVKQIVESCKTDIDTLCKDKKAGRGRIIDCLKENEATLSPACKAAVAEAPTRPAQK